MSGIDSRRTVIRVRSVSAAAGLDVWDAAERIRQEIADRRFGPGNDPIITRIADQIMRGIDDKRGAK